MAMPSNGRPAILGTDAAAEEAFAAYAAIARAAHRDHTLLANQFWRAAADGAFARFRAAFEAAR